MSGANRLENTSGRPLILALETSGDTCGLTLMRGERLISEHTFRHEMRLSERLIAFTDNLLSDAGMEISDVDAFAVGIGPGSFTGVRIGVMTAKTWAQTLQKPLFGVDALEALASHYAGLNHTVTIPLLPCRAALVYAACYNTEADAPRVIAQPAAISISDAAERAKQVSASRIVFCGAAARMYRAELSAALAEADLDISFGRVEFPLASQVASLAYSRWLADNSGDDALELTPLYIVPPQISAPKTAFKTANGQEGI